jgi:hypothetical protein
MFIAPRSKFWVAVEIHDLGNRVLELNGVKATTQPYDMPRVLFATGLPALGLVRLNRNKNPHSSDRRVRARLE